MTAAILAFAAGVWWLQQQAGLPGLPPSSVWVFAALACLPALRWRPWRHAVVLAGAFALGVAWAAGCAQWRLADRLAPELEGRDLVVTGVVASLPASDERGERFVFEVEPGPPGAARLPASVLVSWYRGEPRSADAPAASKPAQEVAPAPAPSAAAGLVHPGERWRFTLRLKRPHGSLNPHGYEISATSLHLFFLLSENSKARLAQSLPIDLSALT